MKAIGTYALMFSTLFLSVQAIGAGSSGGSTYSPIQVDLAGSRFFEASTGATFEMRGASLHRAGYAYTGVGNTWPADPNWAFVNTEHYMFDPVGTNAYSSSEFAAILSTLATKGFNTVRIFLNGRVNCSYSQNPQNPNQVNFAPCSRLQDGIAAPNAAYMANVIDFLSMAKAGGIRIILTAGNKPSIVPGAYLRTYATTSCPSAGGTGVCDFGTEYNANIFKPDVRKAYIEYYVDVLNEIKSAGQADALLAFEPYQEARIRGGDAYPYDMSNPSVVQFNGTSYDMSLASDRTQLHIDSTYDWAMDVMTQIRNRTGLTKLPIGFSIIPNAYHGDYTYALDHPGGEAGYHLKGLKAAAEADGYGYIDIHAYQGYKPNQGLLQSADLDDIMASLGAAEGDQTRIGAPWPEANEQVDLTVGAPLIFGEIGVPEESHAKVFCGITATPVQGTNKYEPPTLAQAKTCLDEVMYDSCNNYSVKGWILWSADDPYYLNGHTDWRDIIDNLAISNVWSPTTRPDACTLYEQGELEL